jgi:parallel beta-helix repeat protein
VGRTANITSTVSVALFVGLLFSSVSVNGAFSGPVSAKTFSQLPSIAVDPQLSVVAVGYNVTISLNVSDVVDLFAWQIVLKYNSTVLNLTELWIPVDSVFAGLNPVSPNPDFGTDVADGLDYVLCGSALVGSVSVNVSAGVLFRANFTGLSTGETPVAIATKTNPVHPNYFDTFYSYLEDSNLNEIPSDEKSGDAVVGGPATFLTLTSTTGGTTSPPPGMYAFLNNSQVSVTALPQLGYDFCRWELDGVNMSSVNPSEVTTDINHTLNAVFLFHVPVTWIVSKNGPANFTSIQEAINSPLVEYSDIVFVKSGIYYEKVGMTKELTLVGEDKDVTIIDGNGTSGAVVSVYGNFSGFTVRNGEYGVDVEAIYVQGPPLQGGHFEDTARIDGNRIVDNSVGGVTVGSIFYPKGHPRNTNTTVSNNYVSNNTLYGIHIWDASNNVVVNNTVENNEYGIDFYGNSHNNTLRNNNMVGNKYNFGIILRGDTTNYFATFLDNDVDASNKVNGKPVYYWIDHHNTQVPSDAGCVLLYNCTNISVNHCSLSNNIEGILVMTSDNTTISENTITSNAYGIYVAFYSYNNSLTGNDLVGNIYGVFLGMLSRYTTMRSNSIRGGLMNFGMDPSFYLKKPSEMSNDMDKTDLANDIDSSNTVDGKPMVYWFNEHDRQVPVNAGFVMLINCSGISIEGLNLTNNLENIVIFASNDTLIRNNRVANSVYGIKVSSFNRMNADNSQDIRRSFNVTVSDNTLVDNGVAIHLLQTGNSTISGNVLDGNPLGILLSDTSYSTISRNMINASDVASSTGLHFEHDLYVFHYPSNPAFYFAWEWSRELIEVEVGGIIVGGGNNIIHGNTVTNSVRSIILGDLIRNMHGSGNIIFHNNFINCSGYMQAYDTWWGNHWDNGYPAGGNYWSDSNKTDIYSGPQQNVSGSDGICDSAYLIIAGRPSAFEYDRYPLTVPLNVYDVAVWNNVDYTIDVQSNSTISEFKFNGPSQASVSFEVTGPEGTSGFCRVTIPKQVLWTSGGQWILLVNGTQVPCDVKEDADYTYFCFNYSHSTETVQIMGSGVVPEFHSSMILAVSMMLVFIVVLHSRKARRKGHV